MRERHVHQVCVLKNVTRARLLEYVLNDVDHPFHANQALAQVSSLTKCCVAIANLVDHRVSLVIKGNVWLVPDVIKEARVSIN